MAVITSANHPAAQWPGIKAFWGRDYKEHKPEYTQCFDMDSSRQAYEEIVQLTGFGYGAVKPEGSSVTYLEETQGYTTRLTHTNYMLGYIVTEEEIDDNLYPVVAKRRTQALSFSLKQTIELVAANIYNRAFNSSYTGGDGLELCSTAHINEAGTFSNELNPAADISEASLEDLCIQIMTTENHKGLKINLTPKQLLIPPNLYFEAARILESVLQNDTSNNAVNVLKSHGVIPEVVVNHYFTDTDSYFIRTDCPSGMIGFNRKTTDLMVDGDFDTGNVKHKAGERKSFGWGDPRGVFGSAGA